MRMKTSLFPISILEPINIVMIGSGHYATGQTSLSGNTATDKDYGVLLPSVLFLRYKGRVGRIAICGQSGDKLAAIRAKIEPWATRPGIDIEFEAYPTAGLHDAKAYIRALDDMPRPCAALIAVPDDLHVEIMLACAAREIPFLIVKPAVTTLKDFYRVMKAMPSGLLGMVDYHKVYDEVNLSLLDDLNNGTYGRLHHVSSLMSQRRDMIEIYQRWLKENPNININHYLGSHYIHMTSFLTGAIPIDVRATQQFGFIKQHYDLDIADSIQTQVRWQASEGYEFTSYHIAGWADPSETEAMTYQQLHLLAENGHIFSDQGYRGTRKVLAGSGQQSPNPYFFNLTNGLLGGWNLGTKYGYQSINNFVEMVLAGKNSEQKPHLPTFAESEFVTAILEAADLSLQSESAIVNIKRSGDYLVLNTH